MIKWLIFKFKIKLFAFFRFNDDQKIDTQITMLLIYIHKLARLKQTPIGVFTDIDSLHFNKEETNELKKILYANLSQINRNIIKSYLDVLYTFVTLSDLVNNKLFKLKGYINEENMKKNQHIEEFFGFFLTKDGYEFQNNNFQTISERWFKRAEITSIIISEIGIYQWATTSHIFADYLGKHADIYYYVFLVACFSVYIFWKKSTMFLFKLILFFILIILFIA